MAPGIRQRHWHFVANSSVAFPFRSCEVCDDETLRSLDAVCQLQSIPSNLKHAVKKKGPTKDFYYCEALCNVCAAGRWVNDALQPSRLVALILLMVECTMCRMGYFLHAEVKASLTFCSIGGCLASVHMAKTPDQAATTELQVLEAPKRRGVAFAFLDMSWDSHKRYLQTLFSHIRSDP